MRASPLLVALGSALSLSACISLPPIMDEEARVRAAVAEQNRQAQRPSTLCAAQPGSPFAFRKKVLVLNFPVANPREAADLPGLPGAWSRALQQRLAASDRFILRDGSQHRIDPNDPDPRSQIIALARQFDAQIVVAGQIERLNISEKQLRIGAYKPIPLPGDDQRDLSAQLEIFDGLSGTPIKRALSSHTAKGDIVRHTPTPLASPFDDSDLGKALTQLLHEQGELVEDELACLPMQARILRAQLHEVHIDAGFTSQLKPGDRLKVFQNPGGSDQRSEKMYGDLLIKQVFPETAIGILDGGERPDWRFNGFVRAW